MDSKLSIIITAHSEKSLLIPTLKSTEASRKFAEENGVNTKIILVLDEADSITSEIAKSFKEKSDFSFDIFEVKFGCPAISRNFALSKSESEFVAIQDGDDLMSINWLFSSINFIENNPNNGVVAHPEWNLTFGKENVIMKHPCMISNPNLYLGNLMFENYWTALSLCKRSVFDQIKYQSNIKERTYGYEDWDWNLRCLEAGYLHAAVPNTFHFIRRKNTGVSYVERNKSSVVRTSNFFLNKKFYEMQENTNSYSLNQNRSTYFDEKAYLLANPDVKDGVKLGSFKDGFEHYDKFGRHEGRLRFPRGLISELKTQSDFEHDLFPESGLLSRYSQYNPTKLNQGTLSVQRVLTEYQQLLLTKTLFARFDHVVLAPWVQPGGADLALLFHLDYLSKNSKKTLLILSENKESNWLNRVPKNISILNFGKLAFGSSRDQKKQLLFHILMSLNVKILHNINSEAGWDVLSSFGEEIKKRMFVITSLYCYDYSQESKPVGYPERLRQTSEYIDLIYSDNQSFIDHMHDYYGVPHNKMIALSHPVLNSDELRELNLHDAKSKNILWASRLDRQKRPDILFEIANKCPEFIFYVFGKNLLDDSAPIESLRSLQNVRLMGGFNGFSSLNAANYFTFLYTSQWDGLPNILLEAAASGLPIISPAIGGIGDFLSDGRGLLCSGPDAIQEYIDHLTNLSKNPSIGLECRELMFEHLDRNHTTEKFSESLKKSGY